MSRSHTVLVAFGGPSPEHEVSVLTAMQIMAALGDTPHKALPLYVTKNGRWLTGPAFSDLSAYQDMKKLEAGGLPVAFAFGADGRTLLRGTADTGLFSKPQAWAIDVVIPAFHGGSGENGAFQGVCEVFNLPCASSGVTASAVGMDKRLAKAVCRAYGHPVLPDVDFRESEWAADQQAHLSRIEALGYPVFVKPIHLGSSIGVRKATDRPALVHAVEDAFRYDAHVLVEPAVSPLREINCSVLGGPDRCEASVCEQPVGSGELLSFQDKYLAGDATKGMASADRLIPAPIPDQVRDRIRTLSTAIYRSLGCSGVVRLDFLMNDATGDVYFNEINTQPGSFSFYLWEPAGVRFPELVARLVDTAFETHRSQTGRVRSYETNLLSKKAAQGLKGLKGMKTRKPG